MSYIEKLKNLVLINSYTKNKDGVDSVGEILKKLFLPLGFELNVHKRENIGNHLHFISKKCDGEKILLLGHMDTVFKEGVFEEFREDELYVYGPGVCDMKGGIVVMYEALELIREHKEINNIDILLVSDEESGSDDSSFLTKEIAKGYDYTLVYEAAGKDGEVVIGRKGIGTFSIDIAGRASHSGVAFKDGIDANIEAAHKLLFLSALSDFDNGITVNVGIIEGGVGANTISPNAKLTFELRYLKESQKETLLKKIDECVKNSFIDGISAKLSGRIQRDVFEPSPKQAEFIELIEKISDKKINREIRSGVSDANVASSAGSITIDGLGPYGDGDHTIKERALKSSFEERIELSFKIFDYFIKEGV